MHSEVQGVLDNLQHNFSVITIGQRVYARRHIFEMFQLLIKTAGNFIP